MLILIILAILATWVTWVVLRTRRIMDHVDRWAAQLDHTLPRHVYVRRGQVTPWPMQEILGQTRDRYRHGDSRN